MRLWWLFVFTIYNLFGWKTHRYWDHQNMRRAIGGLWGKWEIFVPRWGDSFMIWCPSPCEHFPRLPYATSTEPIETENWRPILKETEKEPI